MINIAEHKTQPFFPLISNLSKAGTALVCAAKFSLICFDLLRLQNFVAEEKISKKFSSTHKANEGT